MSDQEPNMVMALLLNNTSFVGPAESIEDEVTPLDSQLNLGPGHRAVVATANTPLERDWTIATLLDAEQYAEKYPDWEERLYKSFVLCQVDSMESGSYMGWFSRLKLVPIPEEDYQRTREWLPKSWPDLASNPPDWILKHFDAFSDALSQRAPNRVPKPYECPNCGGRLVNLEIYRRVEYSVRCGKITRPDRGEVIIPMADVDENESYVARLHCTGCQSYADLKDEEWELHRPSD